MTADPALQASNAARLALEEVAGMVGAAVAALEVQLADAQAAANQWRELAHKQDMARSRRDASLWELESAIGSERAIGEAHVEAIRRVVRERNAARAEVDRVCAERNATEFRLGGKVAEERRGRERAEAALAAEREQNEASVRRVFAAVRDALGARPDESTEEAARRVTAEREEYRLRTAALQDQLDGGGSTFRRRKLAEIRARLAELSDDHLIDVAAWLGAGLRG